MAVVVQSFEQLQESRTTESNGPFGVNVYIIKLCCLDALVVAFFLLFSKQHSVLSVLNDRLLPMLMLLLMLPCQLANSIWRQSM